MFGHKLNFNLATRFGHKNTSPNKFGHKASHSKHNSHTVYDSDDDQVPKSHLERNSTREHHNYHNAHNPAHR